MKRNVLNILNPNASLAERFFTNLSELKEAVDFFKSQGKKIIMTGGSWDMLHVGHVRYLRKAREQGDILIVAIDSDAVIKKDKGPNRPIVSQEERVELVAELRVADVLFMYDITPEWSPENIVRSLCPDVLVMSTTTDKEKNGEFAKKWQKAYEGVCEVIVLEAQATTTTSARVGHLTKTGGKELASKIWEVIQKELGGEPFTEHYNDQEKGVSHE